MPIDPSITLGVKPIDLTQPNPMDVYGKSIALKGLIGQQQLQAYTLAKAQREDAMMTAFQEQMKSLVGHDDIPKIADAMIATGNPAYVQQGVALRQKYAARQALQQMAGGGQTSPMDPNGPNPSVMAGAEGTTPPAAAPTGGPALNQRVLGLLSLDDPAATKAAEMLNTAEIERRKIVSGRPGAPMWGQDAQGRPIQVGFNPKLDEGMTLSPAGTVSAATNYLPTKQALTTGIKSAEQPFQTGTTEIPVLLPNGDQTTVKLNPVQMREYNVSGRLPPEIAASIGAQPSNNPGNLRPAGQSTGFQTYSTPEEGLAAIDKNLQSYGSKGINTLAGIINRWAPPTENNTGAYIADVSKRLGIDPNQPLNLGDPRVRQAVGTGIMLHEQGPQNLFNVSRGTPVVGRTQTQAQNITQARQKAGGTATDEAFAKDYVSFTTGGAQDAAKQIAQLQDTLKSLQTPGSELTGPIRGALPDIVRNVTNPNAVAMRERVEEVVQRSLRAILGAQFTENEGKRLIARAYNPLQPPAENAIRVQRLATQLQQAYAAKQDAAAYFQKNGTLEGWQGKLPSMADFDPGVGTSTGPITQGNVAPRQSGGIKFLGFE